MNDLFMPTLLSWLMKDEAFSGLSKRTQLLIRFLVFANLAYSVVKVLMRVMDVVEKCQQWKTQNMSLFKGDKVN